jgi:hypothetical protein
VNGPRTLRIDVDRESVTATAAGGGEFDGKLSTDPLLYRTVDVLCDLVSEERIARREELGVLGSHLYKIVFDDAIERAFLDQRSLAKQEGRRLLVWLSFRPGAAHLADLPWEYLYCAAVKSPFFLATDSDLVLARYTPGERANVPVQPRKGRLSVLLVVAIPWGEEPVDPREIKEKICPAGKDRGFDVTCARLDDLRLDPPEEEPDVLHFIGAGSADRGIRNPDFDDAWWSDDQFADLLQAGGRTPKLVLLQLWERKLRRGEPRWTFASAGRRLVDRGFPAVVAMQYPMPPKPANEFATHFYTELAKGEEVPNAAWKARWQVTLVDKGLDDRPWGTPVLFVQQAFALVTPEAEDAREREPGGEAGRRVSDRIARTAEPEAAGGNGQAAGGDVATFAPPRTLTAPPAPRLGLAQDPAVLRLVRTGLERARRIQLDPAAIPRVQRLQAELGHRTADERLDWLLERLCSDESYPGEHQILTAVTVSAIFGDLDVRASTASGDLAAAVPPLDPLIGRGCAAIVALRPAPQEAAALRSLLVDLLSAVAPYGDEDRRTLLAGEVAAAGADPRRVELARALLEGA